MFGYLESKEIIKHLIGKDKCSKLLSVRIILHCICTASVKKVESVVESLVSRYENHFNPRDNPIRIML